MAFSKTVWNQVKAATADDLVAALKRDGYKLDPASKGAIQAYIKTTPSGNKRVTIHWHPQKAYGPKLLQGLLGDLGWTEVDLQRVGLIKGISKRENPIATMLVPCQMCDHGIVQGRMSCPICGGTGHQEVPVVTPPAD